MSSPPDPSAAPWWGRFEIPAGKGGLWQVGPFALSALWRPPEWRLAHRQTGDLDDGALAVDCPVDGGAVAEEGEVLRVVAGGGKGLLALTPRTADRPIVARPEKAFRILPGAAAELYVSTPAWIGVEVGEPREPLLDVASWRPSDTWFGPATGDGELCYAIRTRARLHLENLPDLPHRVLTKVLLKNRAPEAVSLERLSLPVPNLSLYADADAGLWTQVVSLKLEGPGKLSEVDMDQGPPAEARGPKLVAGPRVEVQRNILTRAREALLL